MYNTTDESVKHLFVELKAKGKGIEGNMDIVKDSYLAEGDAIVFMYPNEYGGWARGYIKREYVISIDGKTLAELSL